MAVEVCFLRGNLKTSWTKNKVTTKY